MALPGDAAALRFYEDPDTGACMVHDPHRQTLAVAVAVSHPAYVLLSPANQQSRVSAWAGCSEGCPSPGTARRSRSSKPPCPIRAPGWLAGTNGTAPTAAVGPIRNYAELLAQCSHGSSTHRTTITVALDMRRAAKPIREAGRGVRGAAVVLRGQMEVLNYSLRAAELRFDGWLDCGSLAVIVRQAYDPAAELGVDSPGARLRTAGPVGISEHWDYLRHDSGYSCVLWISEWPRQDVAPNFLHPVIFAQGVRRSLTLVAHPLGASEALRQIRKEKTEAITDSTQKARDRPDPRPLGQPRVRGRPGP